MTHLIYIWQILSNLLKIKRISSLKDRNIDIYDSKRDLVQTLVEAGFSKEKLHFADETPSYYHPGKSGKVYLSKTTFLREEVVVKSNTFYF